MQVSTAFETTPKEEPHCLFLVEFAHHLLEFQLPELQSVLDFYGINEYKIHKLPGINQRGSHRSFLILEFRTNADHKIIGSQIHDRCTLTRRVLELWGTGTTLDACCTDALAFVNTQGKDHFQKINRTQQSWKFTIHTLGSRQSSSEHAKMRSKFTTTINFGGKVTLDDPDEEYMLVRETLVDKNGSPFYSPEIDANVSEAIAFYFGRVLAGRRGEKDRGRFSTYSLKKRKYLGPTSMDAELSFIMTNLAKLGKGSFVYDPFVGTASILLSCALRGAVCVGSDIDMRVIRGNSSEEDIWTNFREHNLPIPEIVHCDASIHDRHFRYHTPIYDAIVTDPPYGIRAGAKKCGSRRHVVKPVQDRFRMDHVAQTKPYAVSDVMADLLDTSARTLVLGGRLVYVIPSYADFEAIDLPRHDCLRPIASCYQPFSEKLGRLIVCLEKVFEYDRSKRESYMKNIWVNGPESAEKCNDIRIKLAEEAAKRPDHEQKLAYRRERRKQRKQELRDAKQKARELPTVSK